MRCYNCKGDHETVADVRACHEESGATPSGGPQFDSAPPLSTGSFDDGPYWPASEKQKSYVLGLQDERILPDNHVKKTAWDLDKMERDQVSAEINLLKTYPMLNKSNGRKQYTMPEGRYALYNDEKDKWLFFEVQRGKGRWKGYTFIKRLIGAPGTYRKEQMRASERMGVLEWIEKDPKQAMIDYGLQSGVCGRCSSPLTDADSLKRGLGPICANKTGWF